MNKHLILSLALIAAPVVGGCGSNNTDTLDGGPDSATTTDTIKLFGLSGGDNCYTITAITPGFIDGCALGVDKLVGASLPMNYTAATATVTLGTDGSLGGGLISNNQAALVRDGYPTLTGTTCAWHQTDNTVLQMIADNQFTVTVTEVESAFGATCAAADVPATGTCTSTWTWSMQKSAVTTLVPPACGS